MTVFGELPDAVPVFRKGEGTPLAIIHGASHASGRETRNLAALFRRTEAYGLHVGLLHATPGDADGVARYAPFSQEDLKASGMDYWALGHIHDRREVCREPLAAYPGCTQGLHINEPGEKGCLLVTAEAGPMAGMRCARPSVPSALRSGRRWIWIWAALLRWMNWKTGSEPDWIARLPRSGPAAKCCLCGYGCKDARNWTGCCAKGTTCAELADRLREDGSGVPGSGSRISTSPPGPVWSGWALLEREDLLGEVFRLSEAARTASGLQALREGPLAPLFAHARAGKALEPLTDEELARLLDDAESLVP